MIDFTKNVFFKLKQVDPATIIKDLEYLLLDGEQVVGTYKSVRDYVAFTDKRVIAVNVQGVTGKKKDYSVLPYARLQAFSVETSGVFDLDSELELWFSGLGRVKLEFTGNSDIVRIGKVIGAYIL